MTGSVRVVVVGNGMFGAAATRHLAERGHQVTNIGAPSLPTGPYQQHDLASHPGGDNRVYSSHNDAARLTRRQGKNPDWIETTEHAIAGYRALEVASGVSFFEDVGCLIVSRIGGDGLALDPVETMNNAAIEHTYFAPGDTAWRDQWPMLDFPSTHYVAHEPGPAGYIKPKRLIQAQNTVASKAGAQFVVGTVTSVERTTAGYQVTTAAGDTIQSDVVLVAAGAFSNFNGLLPEPVGLTLKSEVIVLGEVSAADAERLARVPTVKYLIDPDEINDIYMTPPLEFDDGRYYIKLGANTSSDQYFTQLDEVQHWFNTATDADYLPRYEQAMRALWPSVDFLSMHTQPCVITYRDDRMPIIEHVGDGLVIATAGNGGGAKGSDAWGERAALALEQAAIEVAS